MNEWNIQYSIPNILIQLQRKSLTQARRLILADTVYLVRLFVIHFWHTYHHADSTDRRQLTISSVLQFQLNYLFRHIRHLQTRGITLPYWQLRCLAAVGDSARVFVDICQLEIMLAIVDSDLPYFRCLQLMHAKAFLLFGSNVKNQELHSWYCFFNAESNRATTALHLALNSWENAGTNALQNSRCYETLNFFVAIVFFVCDFLCVTRSNNGIMYILTLCERSWIYCKNTLSNFLNFRAPDFLHLSVDSRWRMQVL